MAGVDLYWSQLGAGGHFVRLNGRVYEALPARLQRRPARDPYHSALELELPEATFVIEQAPVHDWSGQERGVVAEGAVGGRWAGRFRIFRYKIRQMPAFFFLGRNDHCVPPETSVAYFDALTAPSKKLVWFERAPARRCLPMSQRGPTPRWPRRVRPALPPDPRRDLTLRSRTDPSGATSTRSGSHTHAWVPVVASGPAFMRRRASRGPRSATC